MVLLSFLGACLGYVTPGSLSEKVRTDLNVSRVHMVENMPAAEKSTFARALCGAFIICERHGIGADVFSYTTRLPNTRVFSRSTASCTRKHVKGTVGTQSFFNHGLLLGREKISPNYFFHEYIYECLFGTVKLFSRSSAGSEVAVYTCGSAFEAHVVEFGV